MSGAPFLFGKLPSHGDFIARGLDAGERAAWDAWASAGMEAARAAFGEAFEAAHDQGPPCRFVLPEGAGPTAGSGAFAPSVDSAGRRFLIVLGRRDAAAAQAGEAAIYAAFEQGLDADGALAAVGEDAGAADGPGWWVDGGAAALAPETPAGVLLPQVWAMREAAL